MFIAVVRYHTLFPIQLNVNKIIIIFCSFNTFVGIDPELLCSGYYNKLLLSRHNFFQSLLKLSEGCYLFFIAERVTYRKLRRKQLILEYIQSMKVVEGIYPFQKVMIHRNSVKWIATPKINPDNWEQSLIITNQHLGGIHFTPSIIYCTVSEPY